MNDLPSASERYHPVSNPAPPTKPDCHRAVFRYVNTKALKVCVAGEFNHWSPDTHPLSRAAGGVWTTYLELPPGRYQYLFVVDDAWTLDPRARLSNRNSHGGINSVILV